MAVADNPYRLRRTGTAAALRSSAFAKASRRGGAIDVMGRAVPAQPLPARVDPGSGPDIEFLAVTAHPLAGPDTSSHRRFMLSADSAPAAT